jgi:UPF0716 protein FxsA
MGKLILLLMALPVVDLYLLVRLGHALGGGVALGLMATSALAGILIARWKGLRELRAWRQALAQGRTPDQGVVHGLLVLLASIWLIMPGVISDVLGLSLLIPAIRRWVAARVTQQVLSAIQRGGMRVATQVGVPPQGPWPGGPTPGDGWPSAERRPSREPGVIDVEGEIVQADASKDRTPKRLEP